MKNTDQTGPYQPDASVAPLLDAVEPEQPQRIGRYRVERLVGKGGFGLVYLAHDEQLQRRVAIKVPHAKLVARPEDARAYLTEARTVANLDHPHIVPVHDVGSTDQFPCFVVSKYIDGADLATRLRQSRLSVNEAVDLTATVAEALHYAHKQSLVHRDVKPGNILLDKSGKPFVADFGLALREQNVGKGPRYAGTPAYMSPEQARGEGHRVDGRSDIFGLGVVLYEMLTGRRPFQAESVEAVLEQITCVEARPLRQIDDRIPKELERICLKALAKRATERYTSATDMADDLRDFAAAASPEEKSTVTGREKREAAAGTPAPSPVLTPSDPQPVKIVPKGLRAFDAHDADFFLELLPGARDRDGLPESIRFWKTRIETTDPDSTFTVALIYGPSGCGKSSLVKAGLLPRLVKSVTVVYVEAAAEETEARLLKGLRRQVSGLPESLGLAEALAALRQGRWLQSGQKVLLVLDQFEQWLHAPPHPALSPEGRGSKSVALAPGGRGLGEGEITDLVQALRQCDGLRVQCIVLVRDDFWLAVSRFMTDLEVDLLQGRNVALVDLFDARHARKVLAAFGRAFTALPDQEKSLAKDQDAFLDQTIAGLSQDGKVISVRLALFAEMVKGKAWTPATLRAVGGIEGVGVTFLEETFVASTAPPRHRLHQKAAQAVLKALLPEAGTDIKGHMRSRQELLEASGYRNRPKDFDELLRILDSELRLITPTDPEGIDDLSLPTRRVSEGDGDPSLTRRVGNEIRYYQLTHDYLVPSLRDWLTRKQKETRRGRAELLLADRAAVWKARPENRQLPSLWQWLSIRWLTAKKKWTLPQRQMMAKAGRLHAVRGLAVGVLLAVATVTGLVIREQVVEYQKAIHEQAEEQRKATYAGGLVQAVLNADTAPVPGIVGEMAEYRKWTDPLLREEYDKAADKSRQKLHVSLALLPVDATQVDYLYDRLLDGEPREVPVIRAFLAPHKDELLDKLWAVVEAPEKERQRLRAAAALAKYDPDSEKWVKVQDAVGSDLVKEPGVYMPVWMEALRPVRVRLLPSLSVVFGDTHRPVEQSRATDILTDYAVDQAQVLAELVMDADVQQFAIFLPKLKDRGEQGVPVLTGEIDRQLPVDAKDEAKEKLAKRQANAAVALLKLDRPEKAWTVLKHSPDPRARSYLIHRLSPYGADAWAIIKRLDAEPDVTIRRALLLSLGEFGENALSLEARKRLLPKVQDIYRNAADSGLHGASEWLLRTWQQEAWLKEVNEEWAKASRERQRPELGGTPVADAAGSPRWYVNGQGQTMVVVPGPVEFMMGSPLTEADRQGNELQHKRRIRRTFALAATPVTKEQFLRFLPKFSHSEMRRYPEPTCPIGGVIWFEAAAYCNWLSKEEGIDEEQWCYETNVQGRVTKLKASYLSLTGYRLPTEAEMEYATRAGAMTSRYFGETDELLPRYAWYEKNSQKKTWPVGSLKPNDLGLFDMQGNLYTWCQESYNAYPQEQLVEPSEDKEDIVDIDSTKGRVLRGGSFNYHASLVRSAYRSSDAPAYRPSSGGFRVARTFTP